MAADPGEALSDLVHDVNAKCTNLKKAAAMLHGKSAIEQMEFLELMCQQARSLSDSITAYTASRRDKQQP